MSDTDDDAWVDGLAGRATDTVRAAREGRALRAALRARKNEVGIEQPTVSLAREEVLLAHARRRQLLPGQRLTRRLAPWIGLAAGFALLAFGISIWLQTPTTPTTTERAGLDAIVRIESADPAGAQRQALAELRQAGIEATGYKMLGRYGIDADWPEKPSALQQQLLAHYRIAAPRDGVLKFEFVAPEAR